MEGGKEKLHVVEEEILKFSIKMIEVTFKQSTDNK